MRLQEKLRRIAAPVAGPPVSPRRDAPVLPGERVGGGDDRYWMRRVRFPLDHAHGGAAPFGRIRATSPAPLAGIARDPGVAQPDFTRAVFFDTETTSLGGGVSTYVFLLGAGYFEPDAFVVEQYFLSALPEERALLEAVNRRFERFAMAVSFYGKGFDAPRLTGRLAFHRMPFHLPPVHLDLCQVGRSLYRHAFADCRLQTFEKELVRFRREDDFPGAECPRAYFHHLQGDSSLIPRVFEHNLHDVMTLPAVAARFVGDVAAPRHPVVQANLGAFHEATGRDAEARRAYRAALGGLRERRHPLLGRTLERIALLERRAGRHAESAACLLERKEITPHAFQPLEDLAKYYEHRVRDLPLAEATALDAKSRILTGKIPVDPRQRRRYLAALDHRLGRLRRRLSKTAPGPS